MITLGTFNQLKVAEVLPMGLIAICQDQQPVFVPYQQSAFSVGDDINVYVYTNQDMDFEGRLEPAKIERNHFASLSVLSVIKAGAFLDWGIKPDLFMPANLMHSQITPHMPAVVRLIYDKHRQQLVGDSKVEAYLSPAPADLNKQESFPMLIYARTPLGYKTIVNQQYSGMFYHNELPSTLSIGQKLEGFVKTIRDDGKLDLVLHRHDKAARNDLNTQILEDLAEHGGISSLTDKSDPSLIYQRFKVSKGAYKKALGHLFKSKKIIISKDYIKLVE